MRILVVALVATLTVGVGGSMVPALTAPGTAPVPARIAEWARGIGLGGLVNLAERVTYRAPKTGGLPGADSPLGHAGADSGGSASGTNGAARRHGANSPGSGSRRTRHAAPPPKPPLTPPTIAPMVRPALSGEDHWHIAAGTAAAPAFAYTFMRPDTVHTSYTTAVTWFNPQRVRAALHPGASEPGPGHWGASEHILHTGGLIAAFNSGFKIGDAHGGYYQNGHYARPLRKRAASFVIDRSGRMQVVQWGRDMTMNPHIVAVRQNLKLLVDHGHLAPGIASNLQQNWGATVGNRNYVWRSGVGERADGTIVNVVGPALSAETLATLLKRAGAVRAMELDINTDWTSLVLYHGATAHNLLPDMYRSAYRYSTTSERDFVALHLRK